MKFTNLNLFLFTIISCGNFKISLSERSFVINYEENSFYMDGKPFQFMSGSAHYFRMPSEYWRDRLKKMKAAGLNTVSTYIEWSQHEPTLGHYNFDGNLDIEKFIEIVQQEGLFLILRPGPYICAERDMGGLPYWLMTKHPNIQLRSADSNYLKYVETWMTLLLEKLSRFFYGRGGPIILVQIENEYGSYHKCDYNYTIWLRDLFIPLVRDDAILFTTDGPDSNFLRCGKIPGVYATVDFPPGANVDNAFSNQRKFESQGPLVNSEYYPGWLTHWGEKMARRNVSVVIKTLKEMLDRKANINFYMFYGGTNFGFTAGANFDGTYVADITSYDYDAPLSEAGDITEKYRAIRELLHQYFPPETNITISSSEKGDYGEISLKRTASLFSQKIRKRLGKLHSNYTDPQSFEFLDQSYGYVLYETKIPENTMNSILKIEKVHDLAHVYTDGIFVGNLSREFKTNSLNIKSGQTLSIVVENLGRINFGPYINDKKGLLSPVILGNEHLHFWNMTGFELKNLTAVEECIETNEISNNMYNECDNNQGFIFYAQKFCLPDGEVLDSYLDVSHLTKGLIFINGFNLGRYWSWRGPQYTIYVPGIYLKPYPQDNVIIILEENIRTDGIKIKFRKSPIFS